MIKNLTCANVLILRQAVKTYPLYIPVNNLLALSQSVRKNIRTRRTLNTLSLAQSVDVQTSIKNLSVNQKLGLEQSATKSSIELSAFNGFIFWHSARTVEWEQLRQDVGLTQTVSVDNCTPTVNPLTLGQTVGVQLIRNILVEQSLLLSGVSSVYRDDSSFIFFVSPPTVPTVKCRFTYGAFTFDVRKPDFDNSKTLSYTRLNRRSRGGDLIIYRYSGWPASITLKMKFSTLSETDKNNFLTLFKVSIGRQIVYRDYLGQDWAGIIMNPATDVQQTGRGQWTVSIELQGVKV
jgi:hypothetical protein